MSDHSTEPQHPSLPRVGLVCAAVAVLIRCAWFWSVKDEAFLYAHVQDSALYHGSPSASCPMVCRSTRPSVWRLCMPSCSRVSTASQG